jgi:hypothetical protein
VTEQPQGVRAVPAFSPQTLMDLYLRGRTDELSGSFLEILRHFRDTTYHTLDAQGRRFINEFVKHFLTLFTQADYAPARGQLAEFVALSPAISNLVALSTFATTDPFLGLLGARPVDTGKFLALCSARNTTAVDRAALFDADPALACAWYSAYAETYRTGLLDPVVWNNLKEHFAYQDDRLDVRHLPMIAYFASTYVGDGLDRLVRSAINRSVRKVVAENLPIRNRPDLGKIAVLSGSWSPTHSAYRITRAFVESLQGYHLTFFPLGKRRDLDLSLFQEVKPLDLDPGGALDIGPLLDNDFSVAYYPDVGLTPFSTLLSNLRVAPVQIASLGHSVSTWGAEIDYYVSGDRVEPPNHPERNYSERLVLLPGLGAVHERPDYTPTGRRNPGPDVIVNCSWNAQKVNHPLGLTLREILRRSRRPVRLRLFVGASLNRQNDYLPFVRDLQKLLPGPAAEVVRELPYRDYMARMEEGDLCLDSYPFGGCNTVVDGLFLRKLTVCREGDTWYNRVGPAMLRMVGLPELVAATEEDFIEITLRLIHDDAFRSSLQDRLDRADLDATVFDRSAAHSFRKAVDFLVANHDRLRQDPDRSPIRIAD